MRRVSQNKNKKTITFVRSFPALLKGMFFSNTFDEALLNLISFFFCVKIYFPFYVQLLRELRTKGTSAHLSSATCYRECVHFCVEFMRIQTTNEPSSFSLR
jgi:preprotein translocase subunit SecB